MHLDALAQLKKRTLRIAMLAGGVLLIGTVGYRLLTHGESSWLDCLYMVVITVSTVGYEEIVRTDHNAAARVFTIFVALFGIGIITYVMSVVTQAAVDGELQKRWRKGKMQKAIGQLNGHFIICGWSTMVPQILEELRRTLRTVVLVVQSRSAADAIIPEEGIPLIVEGDPTSDETLQSAGIMQAAGVFAADEDDHTNIVICLSARGMRPDVRVISSVGDARNSGKLRKAGANSVISPSGIGALRMSSEMIRPSVVTFLDIMLRDKERNLRIEDVQIGASAAGKTIQSVGLPKFTQTVLLAAKKSDGWEFNPKPNYILNEGDVLVVMTTPEERMAISDAVK